MGFDFASARKQARRAVHDTMGVTVNYFAPGESVPVELRARWHHTMGVSGDIANAGYAQMTVGSSSTRTNWLRRGSCCSAPER